MAKKTPKKETSTVETVQVDEQTQPRQKAAVNVDSSNEPKKQPKKNVAKKKDAKPNIFKRMWKGIKGIFSELKKVTWLKGKDVAKNTAVVLVVIVIFFVVLFVIDYVLGGLTGLISKGEWTRVFT